MTSVLYTGDDGLVGIGTKTPGGVLDVQGGVAADNTDATKKIILKAQEGGGLTGGSGANVEISAGNAGGSTTQDGGDITLVAGNKEGGGNPGRVIINSPSVNVTVLEVNGGIQVRSGGQAPINLDIRTTNPGSPVDGDMWLFHETGSPGKFFIRARFDGGTKEIELFAT